MPKLIRKNFKPLRRVSSKLILAFLRTSLQARLAPEAVSYGFFGVLDGAGPLTPRSSADGCFVVVEDGLGPAPSSCNAAGGKGLSAFASSMLTCQISVSVKMSR